MEREIINLINNSTNVLIITHVNPDGDTLGSASALKSYIGDKADILIQIKDNFNFPNTYSFLPHINNSKNLSNLEDKYDLIITVDVASKDRIIENAQKIFSKVKNTVSFDHHKTNSGFSKYNIIRGDLASCAEVLFYFFKNNNIQITQEMAIALYVGVLTDTGCFKYETVTSNTFNIAKELSETGINTSEIADLCYTNKPKNFILFQAILITNARFCFNGKIAYTLITREIMQQYNARDEYSEGICEILRSITGVEVAFVLKETDFGIKASIRTKDVDATQITSVFNGGGHKRAAGCTIKATLNQAAEKLIEVSKKLI